LAEALGRLPLALEQAAAYAARQRLPLARYLKLFARRRDELLAVGKPLAYHGTVDATFTLALDQLRRVRPAAGQLLELCALLAPDELPLSLLLSQPTLLPEPLATEIADPLQQGEVVGVLYRTGLLTRDVAETARMHRLVQDVTLAHLPEADRQQRTMQATELLRRLYPDQAWEPQWWPRCAQPLAHAQTVLDHARAQQLATEAIAALLSSTGDYVRNRGLGVQRARELDFIRVCTLVANNPTSWPPTGLPWGRAGGSSTTSARAATQPCWRNTPLVEGVGLVHRLLIAIHGSALGQPQLDAIAAVGATLMWSPFSNLWLHGTTAAIAQAKAGGLRLCLGSDWAPSGTTNVLWELKVADLWNRPQPQPVFTPQELCELVTANPGDALAQAWPHPVGRLVPGAVADLVVVAQRTPDVYANLIGATERDIRLVLVGGAARYGTTTLMRQAGAAHPTPIRVAGRTRQIDYGDPAVTWPSIKAALQAVRANPQGAADSVAATLAVWAGVDLSQPNAPFILAPDMPSGDPAMATADATAVPPAVRIPPIQPLTPTKTWFDAVDANPFHQGLLSALRNYAP
jgi:5-methylthioadenosine/S-adenosylhomocysteine deaminase